MHLFDQRVLGITILFLLAILVTVKRAATGSVLDKPKGNMMVQLVNIFNLFFLLVVNPLASILLILHSMAIVDPTHITIDDPYLPVLEVMGLMVYVTGYFLMAWALITLRRNYQLGGTSPRPEDVMLVSGPYRLIRHPMYTAALIISLGLACLVQSWAVLCVLGIYLGLIFMLMPIEEDGLQKAYGDRYTVYQKEPEGSSHSCTELRNQQS